MIDTHISDAESDLFLQRKARVQTSLLVAQSILEDTKLAAYLLEEMLGRLRSKAESAGFEFDQNNKLELMMTTIVESSQVDNKEDGKQNND